MVIKANNGIVRMWLERLGYAGMIAAMVIAIAFVWAVVYNYFNSTPIVAASLDSPVVAIYCPGDSFDFHSRITVKEPLLMYYYISVMDKDLGENIQNTQEPVQTLPYPKASSFNQNLTWQVPVLPPGQYNRVITFRTINNTVEPVFLVQPFIIGDTCK